jgi:hypothetical protein
MNESGNYSGGKLRKRHKKLATATTVVPVALIQDEDTMVKTLQMDKISLNVAAILIVVIESEATIINMTSIARLGPILISKPV